MDFVQERKNLQIMLNNSKAEEQRQDQEGIFCHQPVDFLSYLYILYPF